MDLHVTMGLYDFKQRFVKPILAGEKSHTIRAVRKYPDLPPNVEYKDLTAKVQDAA
ncbi:MAG TPA: hypothetical protein VK788_03510 [Terriglobales bacterium]|jgi:hypothetical protein|nr:hypothetical protein [Terriglobales bacterium]